MPSEHQCDEQVKRNIRARFRDKVHFKKECGGRWGETLHPTKHDGSPTPRYFRLVRSGGRLNTIPRRRKHPQPIPLLRPGTCVLFLAHPPWVLRGGRTTPRPGRTSHPRKEAEHGHVDQDTVPLFIHPSSTPSPDFTPSKVCLWWILSPSLPTCGPARTSSSSPPPAATRMSHSLLLRTAIIFTFFREIHIYRRIMHTLRATI